MRLCDALYIVKIENRFLSADRVEYATPTLRSAMKYRTKGAAEKAAFNAIAHYPHLLGKVAVRRIVRRGKDKGWRTLPVRD